MATVRDLLDRKGSHIVSIEPGATVIEAARRMNDHGVGGLLVVSDGGALLGIFTERDILRRVVARGLDSAVTRVAEVLTVDVISCLPETSVEECAAIMSSRRIRHLPVCDPSGLRGLVTSGDVLAFRVEESEATVQYMNSYMFDLR
jgi:CBS domain-containing protein